MSYLILTGNTHIKIKKLQFDSRLKYMWNKSYGKEGLRYYSSLSDGDIDLLGDKWIDRIFSEWKSTVHAWGGRNKVMGDLEQSFIAAHGNTGGERLLLKHFYKLLSMGEKGGLPKALYQDYSSRYSGWVEDVLNEQLLKDGL